MKTVGLSRQGRHGDWEYLGSYASVEEALDVAGHVKGAFPMGETTIITFEEPIPFDWGLGETGRPEGTWKLEWIAYDQAPDGTTGNYRVFAIAYPPKMIPQSSDDILGANPGLHDVPRPAGLRDYFIQIS